MAKGNSFDEAQILYRLSTGDESAFRWVYDRYWKRVFRAAERYLQSRDLAQDVVQEVFSALWYKRETFTHIRNLESYLITVTRNHTYKELQKWASEMRHNEVYASLHSNVTDDSDHVILADQYEALFSEAVNLLPPQQKQVFQLAKIDGLTHEAIARRLNLSQGTVKNHMVRALRFIRRYLAPHVNIFFFFLF